MRRPSIVVPLLALVLVLLTAAVRSCSGPQPAPAATVPTEPHAPDSRANQVVVIVVPASTGQKDCTCVDRPRGNPTRDDSHTPEGNSRVLPDGEAPKPHNAGALPTAPDAARGGVRLSANNGLSVRGHLDNLAGRAQALDTASGVRGTARPGTATTPNAAPLADARVPVAVRHQRIASGAADDDSGSVVYLLTHDPADGRVVLSLASTGFPVGTLDGSHAPRLDTVDDVAKLLRVPSDLLTPVDGTGRVPVYLLRYSPCKPSAADDPRRAGDVCPICR